MSAAALQLNRLAAALVAAVLAADVWRTVGEWGAGASRSPAGRRAPRRGGSMTAPQRTALRQRSAATPFHRSATDRGRRFVTVCRLNNGTPVLARDNGDACTFVNLTQARRAAERVGGRVVGRWPFYVEVA